MDRKELIEIIEKGEDSFTEFKEEKVHSDKLAAEIVAFANTEGGNLIIGVSDDAEILGVSDLDNEMQRIDNICVNNCEPTVDSTTEKIIIDNKKVLVVRIPKGPQRPYRTNKGVYYIKEPVVVEDSQVESNLCDYLKHPKVYIMMSYQFQIHLLMI